MYPTTFSGDGLKNLKFVSKDGIFEMVYNHKGQACTEKTDPVNMGTYNYANPTTQPIHHGVLDVYPYGNILISFPSGKNVRGLGYGNVCLKDTPTTDEKKNEDRYYADTTEAKAARSYNETKRKKFNK